MQKHIITIITMAINVSKYPFDGSEKPISKTEEIYLFPTLTNAPSVLAEIILNQFTGKEGIVTYLRSKPTPDNHLIAMATDGKGNIALYTVY